MKKLIFALIILIAGLVITNDVCGQVSYYYEEVITSEATYRSTRMIDSGGAMIWQEAGNGLDFFDVITDAVYYNHSIADIEPALLPDGIVKNIRLKLFVSAHGDDDLQLVADSLLMDEVNRRHFLVGPDLTDTLNVSETTLADGKVDVALYAGVDDGDFRIRKSVLTVVYNEAIPTDVADDPNVLPADFELRDNYPNPFNPTTTIQFELAKRSEVRIEIFNTLGQLTRVLTDGQLSAGKHEVVWDGRDQDGDISPTGIYFYRMSTNGQTESKKMLLLK